jgi:hypothetical protein
MKPYQATVQHVRTNGGHIGKMHVTLREIGKAIRRGSYYPPIRNLAAMVAARAAPKDFVGQLAEVYNDFIKRWRYVRDPVSKELVTASPEAVYRLVLAGDGVGMGEGLGAGDCDCATVALGAMLEAIGFPTRIATTADRHAPPGPLFGHVFIQAHVRDLGWITLDPVLHPKKKFGDIADYSRIAYWDLDGRLLGTTGNTRGLNGETMRGFGEIPSVDEWGVEGYYGLAGLAGEGDEMPDDWSTVGPMGFGNAVGDYGMIDGIALAGIGVEVDEEQELYGFAGESAVRTPMLEVSPDDYVYMSFVGTPYPGMMALGDDGEMYAYDGSLGFFKKLFRKIKRGVKKVGSRIKKGIRKVLKKSKFGRFLLKVGGKIKKIAMKIVRPLMKFVGKWASKLAPIAAMIPGYGTAIAAGLAAAGKVAKVMQKWGVSTKGPKGKVRGLKLADPKKLPAFKKALDSEARAMQAWSKKNPQKFKAMLAKQQQRLQAK